MLRWLVQPFPRRRAIAPHSGTAARRPYRVEGERAYGPGVVDRQRAMFEAAGLPFAGTIEKIPNSRGALILGELARERELLRTLHPRLFDAYWGRGRDIGEEQVLIEEGTAVGLSEADIREALADERHLPQIEASTRNATEIGAEYQVAPAGIATSSGGRAYAQQASKIEHTYLARLASLSGPHARRPSPTVAPAPLRPDPPIR